MKNYLGNSTNKRNTDYLVKNTTASNVFYIVLAFRFANTIMFIKYCMTIQQQTFVQNAETLKSKLIANYSMDRFRGRNDIELYTKSADNRKLDVESQIEWLFIKGIIPDDLTIEDFEEIIDDYRD